MDVLLLTSLTPMSRRPFGRRMSMTTGTIDPRYAERLRHRGRRRRVYTVAPAKVIVFGDGHGQTTYRF